MKVAIFREWFAAYLDGEKVVEQILQIHPQADLLAVIDLLADGERVAAVHQFESTPQGGSAAACRAHAEHFTPMVFHAEFKASIDRARGIRGARAVTAPNQTKPAAKA